MKSLRAMADETGISPATLSRWAAGRDVSQDTILRLLEFLDTDLQQEVEAALNYLRIAVNRRSKVGAEAAQKQG